MSTIQNVAGRQLCIVTVNVVIPIQGIHRAGAEYQFTCTLAIVKTLWLLIYAIER